MSRPRPHTPSRSSTPASRPGAAPLTAALLACALLLALAGCTSGGGSEPTAGPDETAGVIAPGRPGEDAATLSPEEAGAAADAQETEPNAADMSFMTMMIVHHTQALEMTGLAEQHAEDPRVRRLAERIAAAQTPEIAVMEAWLEQHRAASGHDHHHDDAGSDDHSGMPGMASPAQLAELAEARGTDFDRLFLDLMTVHHEGAVTMSADVLATGGERVVSEMATEIAAQQTAEAGRMERLRTGL
jgi:uncharacterized protein (DUF305 family)